MLVYMGIMFVARVVVMLCLCKTVRAQLPKRTAGYPGMLPLVRRRIRRLRH